MSYDRGPRFAPAESDDPERRIRRVEDWAGRHDQWAAQTAVEVRARAAEVEGRVGRVEDRVTRLFAAIGEHRLTATCSGALSRVDKIGPLRSTTNPGMRVAALLQTPWVCIELLPILVGHYT